MPVAILFEPEASMRFRSLVPALLGLGLLFPMTAGSTVAGTRPTGTNPPVASVSLIINDCAFRGGAGFIPGNVLTIRHRSASGASKQIRGVTVTGNSWKVECPGPRVRAGDRLEFLTSDSTIPFKVLDIPALRLRPDRAHDRLRGNAPGDPDTVAVSSGGCDPALRLCRKGIGKPVTPKPDTGAFSVSQPGLTGGALAVLAWSKGDDRVFLQQHTPRMVVQAGSATVSGFGRSVGQRGALSLRRGRAIGRTNPKAGPDAAFKGVFKRAGTAMKVRAGDIVSGSFADDAAMRVPETTLGLGGAGVEGQCFKNGQVTVEDFGFDGSFIKYEQTTADASGRWTAPFALQAGHTFKAWCANAKGDVVLNELLAI